MLLPEWNIEIVGICAVSAFACFWLIRVLYVLCLYLRPLFRLAKKDNSATLKTQEPVSVIVIALNKGPGFILNIRQILAQQYPIFEVIAVIDNADKDVEDELKLLMHDDNRLRYTFVPHETKNVSRRKLALTIALKSARYDWILQTEYSCRPASDRWIERMMGTRAEDTEIVLGGTVTEKVPAGIRRTMAYYNQLRSLQMLACGICRLPYVGNAANLLMRKDLLFKHITFGKSLKEELGEDLVMVNAAATRKNTEVELKPESLTINSFPDKKDWILKDESIRRCRPYLKGFGKTLWQISPTVSFFYLITLLFAVYTQLQSVVFLSAIGGMHLLYRILFWGILLRYSNKTHSARFYTLPFYSSLIYPFTKERKRSRARRR